MSTAADFKADPLNCDLSTLTESLRPLLLGDRMNVKINKAEIKATKDNQGRYIALELETLSPQKSVTTGNPLTDPGVLIFDQVMLNPTGKATFAMVGQKVSELVQATRVTGATLGSADIWHKQLEGKVLFVQVDYEGPSTGADGRHYDAKNVVKTYLKQ